MAEVQQERWSIVLRGDPEPWHEAEEVAPVHSRRVWKLTRYWPNGYPQVKFAYYEDVELRRDGKLIQLYATRA